MALTGAELLAAVDELKALPKAEIVRHCGYVTTTGTGAERLNYTAFYEALLDAKGLRLGAGGSRVVGKAGRALPFHTKVQFNGNLMVGRAYIDLLDLKPGDHCAIKLGRHGISLVPIASREA
jgi:hypothetical protein